MALIQLVVLFAGIIASESFILSGSGAAHVNDYCNKDCSSAQKRTVCGSDGKYYASTCEFGVAACLSHEYHNRHLRITNDRVCNNNNTVNNILSHCDDLCNEDVLHVCASDGVVYDNPCLYARARCEAYKQGKDLFIVSWGDVCPTVKQADCDKYEIDLSDLALEDPNKYVPKCPSTHDFVCASDGHTFSNECQVCAYMDTNKVDLKILNDSPCMH